MKSDTGRTRDKAKDVKSCQCPFCDAKIEMAHPFCKACGRTLRRCPKCGRALGASETECPSCAR